MIGGTPHTNIQSINLGFDWDRGKLIIYPEQTLSEIDRDEIKTLKDKYTEQSVEDKSPNIIYSFKKNKTKVLLYKKAIDERSVQIKILYYSTDLFRMLISE